jgi:hypothetical protein
LRIAFIFCAAQEGLPPFLSFEACQAAFEFSRAYFELSMKPCGCMQLFVNAIAVHTHLPSGELLRMQVYYSVLALYHSCHAFPSSATALVMQTKAGSICTTPMHGYRSNWKRDVARDIMMVTYGCGQELLEDPVLA